MAIENPTDTEASDGQAAGACPFERLAINAQVDAALLAQHCSELADELYGQAGDTRALALQALLARISDLCEIATEAMDRRDARDVDSLDALQRSLALKPGRDWIGRQGDRQADAKMRAAARGGVQ